jgi:hypothetical protein
VGTRIRVALAACAAAAVATAHADGNALDALVAHLDQTAREVARTRGLPLRHAVAAEVVDRDALKTRVAARLAEPHAQVELAATGLVMARLGELPAGTDYPQLVADLLVEQIAGSYDPATKTLLLARSASLDDAGWADMVVAHELDHALQDQSFDLRKFLAVDEPDAILARRALVEGDGIATMLEVALARQHATVDWSNAEVAVLIDKVMEQGAGGCSGGSGSACGGAFDRAPFAVRENLVFPYRAGFRFVAALRHRQTWPAVDAAFRRPPKSTAQIMHPERYLDGDAPATVTLDPPPALKAWNVGATMVWGEHGFDVFLRAHGVDAGVAADAAAGWSGDRVVVLLDPEDASAQRACAIARMEWESEADAIEAEEAAARAVDDLVVGATVEHVTGRSRWLGLDGTVAVVERKGPSLLVIVGAPAGLAVQVATEAWTKSRVKRR